MVHLKVPLLVVSHPSEHWPLGVVLEGQTNGTRHASACIGQGFSWASSLWSLVHKSGVISSVVHVSVQLQFFSLDILVMILQWSSLHLVSDLMVFRKIARQDVDACMMDILWRCRIFFGPDDRGRRGLAGMSADNTILVNGGRGVVLTSFSSVETISTEAISE